jgi:hypothetical protein
LRRITHQIAVQAKALLNNLEVPQPPPSDNIKSCSRRTIVLLLQDPENR